MDSLITAAAHALAARDPSARSPGRYAIDIKYGNESKMSPASLSTVVSLFEPDHLAGYRTDLGTKKRSGSDCAESPRFCVNVECR
jgi:hypothetical protein